MASQRFKVPVPESRASQSSPGQYDDEESASQASGSSSRPSEQQREKKRSAHTQKFTVLLQGTLDQFATSTEARSVRLFADPAALHGEDATGDLSTRGMIKSATIIGEFHDFPFPVVFSSEHFVNSSVFSPEGKPVKRGFAIVYPGKYSSVRKPLVCASKNVDHNIASRFSKTSEKDLALVSFIKNEKKVKESVQIWKGNPLIEIIKECSKGKEDWNIQTAVSAGRKGIHVSMPVYEAALECYKRDVEPHLIKQDLSQISFEIDRLNGEWSEPISPELTDPRFRRTTYCASLQIQMEYVILE